MKTITPKSIIEISQPRFQNQSVVFKKLPTVVTKLKKQ